jgi:ABC-type nitrate/sulfonate/bicarbonate transport system substrate-binding protein
MTVALVASAGTQVASAQTKIAIAHPGTISTYGSILLAISQEQGLFAKYGLEVRLIGGSPATGSIQLVGKEAEFGVFGTAGLLNIAQQRTNLKMFGAFSTGRISSHLVTKAQIKKPEDLRGKRFGIVGAIGGAPWTIAILALEHLGLDPKRDIITFVSVENLTQITKALEDGTIDAAMLVPAQSNQMKSKGFSVLLDMYPSNIYGVQTVLVATGVYLQQHSDVVEKVVTALVEAMAFSLGPMNQSTVLRTIMKTLDLTDAAAAERGYEDLRELNRKPYPTLERMKNIQKVMALHDPKVLSVTVQDVIDDRFVRKLDESGVMDRLYGAYGVK